MDKNTPNRSAISLYAGFALLILGAGVFYFFSAMAEKNAYTYLLLLIALVISALSAIYAYFIYTKKIPNAEPDYRTIFIMGMIFLPMAFSSDTVIFPVISFGFIAIGLANRKKWKNEPKWSEMSPARRTAIAALVAVLGILVAVTFAIWYMASVSR